MRRETGKALDRCSRHQHLDLRPAVWKHERPTGSGARKSCRHDTLAIAVEIETELMRTLVDKFHWPLNKAREAMQVVLQNSIRYTLQSTVRVCRDPKDDMFLELSALAKAGLLITGDKDLLVLGSYQGTRIITPREYISLSPGR